jgi:hypothetical protein
MPENRNGSEGFGGGAFEPQIAAHLADMNYRVDDNDPRLRAAFAEELVNLRPNAIFIFTGPAVLAVKGCTQVIPIVFAGGGDAVDNKETQFLASPVFPANDAVVPVRSARAEPVPLRSADKSSPALTNFRRGCRVSRDRRQKSTLPPDGNNSRGQVAVFPSPETTLRVAAVAGCHAGRRPVGHKSDSRRPSPTATAIPRQERTFLRLASPPLGIQPE